MSRSTPISLAVLVTIGLAVTLGLGASGRPALQAWLLALGSLGLAAGAFAASSAAGPARVSRLERALRRRPPEPERPRQLERIEREVVLGAGSAFDLHYRLRLTLRAIAAQRLADRHGVELDAAGPDVLTADTWALLRPDREPPRDRHGVGIPLDRLAAIVDELEAL